MRGSTDSLLLDPTPLISVVICTYNRQTYLQTAIENLISQDAGGVDWELIVIDNNSTDGTAALCARYQERGLLRYVHEPELGLCFARNTGWRCARGAIVAYLDDDAVAEPGWLKAICDAFRVFPRAGVVGGRVLPIWQAQRPIWLSDGIALSLTIVDWSAQPTEIPDVRVQWLVGANMAVRTDVLREVGGFDPRLDRVGTNMLSGGDVYLQERIINQGYQCIYHPEMAVRHLVPQSRLQKRWFTRRYYWQGISDAVMLVITSGTMTRRDRWSRAGRAAISMLRRPRQIIDLLLPTNDPARFEVKCLALIQIGFIAGMLGEART